MTIGWCCPFQPLSPMAFENKHFLRSVCLTGRISVLISYHGHFGLWVFHHSLVSTEWPCSSICLFSSALTAPVRPLKLIHHSILYSTEWNMGSLWGYWWRKPMGKQSETDHQTVVFYRTGICKHCCVRVRNVFVYSWNMFSEHQILEVLMN